MTPAQIPNVLKATSFHFHENRAVNPESYSVPDPGPGVASCQLTWRDGLPQVAVRSRSGRSFTLP
jgi:hypothetical protein